MNRSPPYTLSTFTAHREIGHHLLHFIHIIIYYPGGTGRHLIHVIHIHTTFGGQVATWYTSYIHILPLGGLVATSYTSFIYILPLGDRWPPDTLHTYTYYLWGDWSPPHTLYSFTYYLGGTGHHFIHIPPWWDSTPPHTLPTFTAHRDKCRHLIHSIHILPRKGLVYEWSVCIIIFQLHFSYCKKRVKYDWAIKTWFVLNEFRNKLKCKHIMNYILLYLLISSL